MEVVMCCCVGALVSVSAAALLAAPSRSTGVSPQPVRLAFRRSESPLDALAGLWCEVAVRLGDRAICLGAPRCAVMRAAGAMRGLGFRGRTPFADMDDATALGSLCMVDCICTVLAALLSYSAVGALAGAVGFPCALAASGAAGERRRRAHVERAMPEAFGALSVSLGSGLSLAQALRYVGSHAEEPVGPEFVRASGAMRCGIAPSEALEDLLRRMDAPGLDLVVLSLKISQRTGAPLKGMLSEAAAMVGERMDLRRTLEVKTSQARMSARLVALMPVVMIAFLSLVSADFREGVSTGAGTASIAIALTLNLVAWMSIKRIMKVGL